MLFSKQTFGLSYQVQCSRLTDASRQPNDARAKFDAATDAEPSAECASEPNGAIASASAAEVNPASV
jgi:hypothetical protein